VEGEGRAEKDGEEEKEVIKKCNCALCRQARLWKAFARLETAIVSAAGKNPSHPIMSNPARKAERRAS
jgi:hypothetical protein